MLFQILLYVFSLACSQESVYNPLLVVYVVRHGIRVPKLRNSLFKSGVEWKYELPGALTPSGERQMFLEGLEA